MDSQLGTSGRFSDLSEIKMVGILESESVKIPSHLLYMCKMQMIEKAQVYPVQHFHVTFIPVYYLLLLLMNI